jgi:hypothetical protein
VVEGAVAERAVRVDVETDQSISRRGGWFGFLTGEAAACFQAAVIASEREGASEAI